jgi:hypothetical protein
MQLSTFVRVLYVSDAWVSQVDAAITKTASIYSSRMARAK